MADDEKNELIAKAKALDRFDGKWIAEPMSGCWIWTAAIITRHGFSYGNIGNGYGGTELAHRFGYKLYRGEIPIGLELDHKCRNTLCVNPWHLEAVTHKENCLRGDGVSAINAAKTHCKNGHPLTDDNLTPGTIARGVRGCRICIYTKGRGYYIRGPRGPNKNPMQDRKGETKEQRNARRKQEYAARR